MEDVLLSQAESVTRSLLESHFGGDASFPRISAQRRTSMDDSEYVEIRVIFDGDASIIDDPLWYDHEWHAKVDHLFGEGSLVIYRLDKATYTAKDKRYLDKRIEELSDRLCKA